MITDKPNKIDKPIRAIQDIDKDELDYLISYKDKEVLCIEDNVDKGTFIGGIMINTEFYKGKYYKISEVLFGKSIRVFESLENLYAWDKDGAHEYVPLIMLGGMRFYYDEFFEYFEPVTIEEVRIRKIKNILD